MTSKEYLNASEALPSYVADQAIYPRTLLSHHHCDGVGNLPSEIISTIFRFSLHPQSLGKSFSNSVISGWHVIPEDPAPTQLNLVTVCRRWRDIALNDPHLWNRVTVCLNEQTPVSTVSGFKSWLSRSGRLPLSIYLDWVPIPNFRERELHHLQFSIGESLVVALLSFASRVARLYLRLPMDTIYDIHQNPSKWPLLEEASIEYLTGSRDSELMKSFRIGKPLNFDDAPQLQHLRLSSCYFEHVEALWVNITQFRGRKFSSSECLRILQAAPQLYSCSFDEMFGDDHPCPTVLHQNISHLTLDGIPSDTWDNMSCPKLQDLEVISIDYSLANGPIEFLRRSQCSLKVLTLVEDSGRLDGLKDLLELIPTLEWLTVWTIEEDVLRHLADTTYYSEISKEPPFLPNLRSFHFSGPRNFTWPCIPAIAPVISSDISKNLRRPLFFVSFFVEVGEGDSGIIDKSSLEDIIEAINAGVDLHVQDFDDRFPKDLILLSMDFHGIGSDRLTRREYQ